MLLLLNTIIKSFKGDVTWSRYRDGGRVILVTITNGKKKKSDKRYSSLADNSLVIRKVTSFDTAMYWCNKTQVYLNVITPPNTVAPRAGNVPVTQRNNGLGSALNKTQRTNNLQTFGKWLSV